MKRHPLEPPLTFMWMQSETLGNTAQARLSSKRYQRRLETRQRQIEDFEENEMKEKHEQKLNKTYVNAIRDGTGCSPGKIQFQRSIRSDLKTDTEEKRIRRAWNEGKTHATTHWSYIKIQSDTEENATPGMIQLQYVSTEIRNQTTSNIRLQRARNEGRHARLTA